MSKRIKPFTLVLILLVIATACTPEVVDSTALVYERYLERAGALTGNLLNECQDDVIEAALERADSLLIDRARRMRRIEGRPPRPNRPGAPPVQELSQPLPLRPLFPFEIRFDTLLRDSLYQDSLRWDSIDRGLLPEVEVLRDSF
ncbi:hypothetical protein [Neolewinella persica]|uniref:hypothetical protein n=1 Tax=Neolewinella persica TaxID=70998 RepID=UPI0003780562|nr:hypothetical protein [Neolewinella persica]